MNIEFGLSLTFDGKSYTLLSPNHVRDYPLGSLICEYCRLVPTKIKDVILSCRGLDSEVTPDTVTTTIMEFHN